MGKYNKRVLNIFIFVSLAIYCLKEYICDLSDGKGLHIRSLNHQLWNISMTAVYQCISLFDKDLSVCECNSTKEILTCSEWN